jgi:glycosyltransferase involved in cell wall biosynthesis
MKILHVVTLQTPTSSFGGPTQVAVNLAKELIRAGEAVELLALADGYDGTPPSQVDGVPSSLYPARHVAPALEVSGISSWRLLRASWKKIRAADVVHVHLMRDMVTLPVALLTLLARRPLVLQTHGMIDTTENRLARVLDFLAVRTVLRRASIILHLTDFERRELLLVAGRPRLGSLRRLVNGVGDLGIRNPESGGPTVLFLARMQSRKRPEDFVKAAVGVLKARPDARFVMAGPDSGALLPVLSLAKSLGVDWALNYEGPLSHDDAIELMRTASVYVLPSVNEPFPVSVLEALALGVPVVVTSTNGLAGGVAEAGAGVVVSSAGEIAEAVLRLLDPAENAAASDAATRLAKETFSLSVIARDLSQLYSSLLMDSPSTRTRRLQGM